MRADGGWNSPDASEHLQKTIKEASLAYYEKEEMGIGEGVSIALMGKMKKIWPKGQFIVTGVLGPNSNAHGPNEFLHLDYTKRLICCIAHIIGKITIQKIHQK